MTSSTARETSRPSPTRDQFDAYTGAFDYFNAELFAGELPACILNFCRKSARTMGFFAPERWARGDARTHEISLNPDVLSRPIRATMATLVHEMVHLWQQECGTPSRSGYHNIEWGRKMEAVGSCRRTRAHPAASGPVGR